MTPPKKKTFETALSDLEKIVEALESGELPLETALEKFETGVKLADTCAQKLNAAEEKIRLLTKDEQGNLDDQPHGDNNDPDAE